MIFDEITAGVQMECRRWTCATESDAIEFPKVQEKKDFCLCEYECERKELAFFDLNNKDDGYKNDYRQVLYQQTLNSQYVEFFIVDSSDNTYSMGDYGEYYPPQYFTERPLLTGARVDWWNVGYELGAGEYRIRTVVYDFGVPTETDSHTFIVAPYDEKRANGTVKIEIDFKGFTQNGENWLGLDTFRNMVRLTGRLNIGDPEIEKEEQITGSRKNELVQVKKRDTYTLVIDDLTSDIGDSLLGEGLLHNWIVSDYDLFNYKEYIQIELEPDSQNMEDIKDYTKRQVEVFLKAKEIKVNRKYV